jgi:hypothetical protein
MIFAGVRSRMRDMTGIAALCRAAEDVARAEGAAEPAAEHFVLAALDMTDDSAARAWTALGQSRDTFRAAINGQFADALAAIGIDADIDEAEALPEARSPGLFRASGSGQALLQAMAAAKKRRAPFRTAEVLAAAATLRHGVVPRALRRLEITPDQLAAAAAAAD